MFVDTQSNHSPRPFSGGRQLRPPNHRMAYIVNRENSFYSPLREEDYYYDEGLGGWFKSITKAFTAPFKAVVKVATAIAKPIGKVLALPIKLTGRALIATRLPGSRKLGKPLLKIAAVAQEIPVAGVRLLATGAKVPFVLARGVTTGQIGKSLQQVERETRQAGGKPLAWLVKGAKVIVPAVLTYVFPPIGLALTAAIVARDVYWAKRESKLAEKDMEDKIGGAYQTYVQQVNKAGVAPTDYNTFRNWVLAGAEGDIPLGSITPGGVARTMTPGGVARTMAPPEQVYGGGAYFPTGQPMEAVALKEQPVVATTQDSMLKYVGLVVGALSLIPKGGRG
jgi:hypothetical protein